MIYRKKFTINATTSWTEKSLDVPSSIKIHRVRAITSSPGTEVALSIREKSNPDNNIDIPLEYSLSVSPLDSDESSSNIIVIGQLINNSQSRIYIAIKTDTDCSVNCLIEYSQNVS